MTATDAFQCFRQAYDAGTPQVVSRRLRADLDTPVSAFLKLAESKPYSFLLESVTDGEVRGRYSFVGFRPDIVWRCRDGRAALNRQPLAAPAAFVDDERPPLDSLRALIAESRIDLPADLPPMAAGLVGYLGYDMVRLVEDLPDGNADSIGVDDAILVRPTIVAVFDGIEDVLTLVTPVRPEPGIDAQEAYRAAIALLDSVHGDFDTPLAERRSGFAATPTIPEPQPSVTRTQFEWMVERAKSYIHAGDAFQIVPSQRVRIPFDLPPFDLYRALRRLNPSPYLFYLAFDDFALVGSSPEILVRVRGNDVTIRPLAGTRPRGGTSAEDRTLADELLSDPKELAEHLMLLDLGRNDVGRVADIGSVRVTERNAVERYSHVMHLVSNVTGRIAPGKDAIDALMGGFPAGTVTGAPKIRAMEIIDELEPERRSFYAGAVGYFGAGGDLDTCIALRTCLVRNQTIYAQAGVGVVADSDSQREYDEAVNKAKAIVRAAQEAARHAGSGRN